MPRSKFLWIDLETSGLDPKKAGIIQAACIVEIEGEVIARKEFFMNPVGKELNSVALNINGYSQETVMAFPPAVEVKKEIQSFMDEHVDKFNPLDKFFVAGYNVNFDMEFLSELWADSGDVYIRSYFHAPRLDVMNVQALMENINLSARPKKYTLSALCDFYGIEVKGAHNAAVDIENTRMVYKAMKNKIREV